MPKNEFYNYLEFEKRFSPHTIISYKTDIEQFHQYLITEFELNNIAVAKYQFVRSWIVSLMNSGLASKSVNRKISSLRSFYKFLKRQAIIEENPMAKITGPKQSKRLPVFVEQASMNELLDKGDFGEGYKASRDRLIIELFYSLGIRLSELINIKESDINFHNSTIKVLGKRNKERIIPFTKELRESLQCFQETKIELGFSRDYLLHTEKNKKVYEKLVYRVVNHYLSTVSTLTKKSHMFCGIPLLRICLIMERI
ncbi:MAG: site-specific integrase [Flavobacteriales bacterium]|nr:site-specific integrase [Flavobacteriales bacterium]